MPLWGLRHSQRDSIMLRMSEIARKPPKPKPVPVRTWERGEFLAAKYMMTEREFMEAIASSRWDHYVYGLCLDNGAVFYVGKGCGFRALDHVKSAAQEDLSEKAQYIQSIGERLRYTIFMNCADDVFAKGYEAYLIRGHRNVLTNIVIPSVSIIDKMFEPVDQLGIDRANLALIDEKIKAGDRECRLGLLSIISDCPDVLPQITDADLAWAMGVTDGTKARAAIQEQLEAMTNGS